MDFTVQSGVSHEQYCCRVEVNLATLTYWVYYQIVNIGDSHSVVVIVMVAVAIVAVVIVAVIIVVVVIVVLDAEEVLQRQT